MQHHKITMSIAVKSKEEQHREKKEARTKQNPQMPQER